MKTPLLPFPFQLPLSTMQSVSKPVTVGSTLFSMLIFASFLADTLRVILCPTLCALNRTLRFSFLGDAVAKMFRSRLPVHCVLVRARRWNRVSKVLGQADDITNVQRQGHRCSILVRRTRFVQVCLFTPSGIVIRSFLESVRSTSVDACDRSPA